MDILIGIPLRNNKFLSSSSLFRLYVVCHIMQNLYILCYVHQSVMGSGLVSLAFHWNLAVRTAHLEPHFYLMLRLPQKEVHEEDYSKEQHGQRAAHLSDDREPVQVGARDGIVESLKGTKAREPLFTGGKPGNC